MSEDKKDGGPAFPVSWEDERKMVAKPGMSLRDWFAGQALIGLAGSWGLGHFQRAVTEAYQAADAMLLERKK